MVFVNRTSDFRACFPSSSSSSPSSSSTTATTANGRSSTEDQGGLRKRNHQEDRQGGVAGNHSNASNGTGVQQKKSRKVRKLSEKEKERLRWQREFLNEAYRIHEHLTNLSRHLHMIRTAYLASNRSGPQYPRASPAYQLTHGRPGAQGTAAGNGTENASSDPELNRLRKLESARWLTDRERDEVELRSKVVLQGCKERVSVLEIREKTRHEKESSGLSVATSTFLSSLLPSLTSRGGPSMLHTGAAESVTSAHNASIIWSLNHLLLQISELQKEMQEERVQIRLERERSLGSLVSSAAAGGSLAAPSRLASSIPRNLTIPIQRNPDENGEDDDRSKSYELTKEQAQMFAQENDELLESMQTTLNSVLAAEKSLSEISQLQSTLVAHLSSQAETIDRLYDDAIATVADVERANQQLRKAKERGGSARLFLLVFLIGASLALLFVDWYKT